VAPYHLIFLAANCPGKTLFLQSKANFCSMFFRRSSVSDLERLEREGNNDFQLLAELGPEHFGMEHLLELRTGARDQIAVFEHRRRLSMIIGGTATGWVLLGMLGAVMQMQWLSLLGYVLAGLCFSAFLGMIIWQKVRFESRGELEFTLQVIEEELRKRASKKTA